MSIHWLKYRNAKHGKGERATISIRKITCRYCLQRLNDEIKEYEKGTESD